MTLPSLLSLKIYIHIYIFIWHHGGSCLRLHPALRVVKADRGRAWVMGDRKQLSALQTLLHRPRPLSLLPCPRGEVPKKTGQGMGPPGSAWTAAVWLWWAGADPAGDPAPWENHARKKGFQARHLVSTIPRLGGPRLGAAETLPTPTSQSRTGRGQGARFGSKKHGSWRGDREGSGRQGPRGSPPRRWGKFKGTDKGAQGYIVLAVACSQFWWGDPHFPQGTECGAAAPGFFRKGRGRRRRCRQGRLEESACAVRTGSGQVLAPARLTSSRAAAA